VEAQRQQRNQHDPSTQTCQRTEQSRQEGAGEHEAREDQNRHRVQLIAATVRQLLAVAQFDNSDLLRHFMGQHKRFSRSAYAQLITGRRRC
jgi:hypothetical protein